MSHVFIAYYCISAGLGCRKLEYDANKNPEIFQQLCELQLQDVIKQASNTVAAAGA